jgi:OmpA-OmpF porin, OOP family
MRTAALCSLALVLVSSSALAQTPVPSFNLERLELDNSAKASLTLAGGGAMLKRQYRVFGALHYQHRPLLLQVDGADAAAVVQGRFTVHLGGAYAIIDGLEIGLQIPVVVYQGGDDLSAQGLRPPDAFGFGAPVLSARWAFLRKTAGMPFDMAVDLAVPIPIGSNSALANDPGFGLVPRVSAGFDVSALRINADIGVKIRPYTPMGTRALGSEFTWGVGMAVNIAESLRLEAALKSYISFANVPAGFELLGGARYTIGALELFVLGGPGLGTSPGTPAFRLILGAAAASTAKPRVVEEKKPEPVVAKVDPCVEGTGYDLKQCPDLDADGDGVKNGVDACPTEPEDKDSFKDDDGCPDPDNDGDGILDGDDACPNEAGVPEKKGCPVRDEDKDGIEDSADLCPKEPGVPEFRGCPPQDQDKDGVFDNVDNCPTEPGPADNQGCPVKKKQLVIITKEKLVIKDKVYFDTGKATIQARSNLLLTQIADILKGHPEITRVRIEGHTDSTGSAETNRKLSAARANAVRDFLMKAGVTPDRMTSQGFGPDRPAMPNDTRAGKEANRRVEFLIGDEQPALQNMDDDLVPLSPSPDQKPEGGK